MPTLKNPKHELFAQELAKGVGTEDAYVIAGFKRNRANANTLRRGKAVSTRLAELLEKRERADAKATEKAIDRMAISRVDVIQMLLDDRELARSTDQVSAAIAAAKLIGMEMHGMFITRSETKVVDRFSAMTAEQLRDFLLDEGVRGVGENDGPKQLPSPGIGGNGTTRH